MLDPWNFLWLCFQLYIHAILFHLNWLIRIFLSLYFFQDIEVETSWFIPSFSNRMKENSPWKRTNLYLNLQFSSVAQSCPTLCDPRNRCTACLPVHHQLPEFTQTHVHRVSDAIQPSHPLSSPSPPARNPSQHQSLFQWVNSSHEVAKILEFQL